MPTIYADRLYRFLAELGESANSHNLLAAGERIEFAKRHYVVPLTSEFLGVSMLALKDILSEHREILTTEQITRAEEYVTEIKRQFFS